MSDMHDDMLPLSGDTDNAFEHELRKHVRVVRELWEKATTTGDYRVPPLYVSYAADEGKWTLRSYTPDTTTQGAELAECIRAHISAWRRQQSLQILRGRLPAPPTTLT